MWLSRFSLLAERIRSAAFQIHSRLFEQSESILNRVASLVSVAKEQPHPSDFGNQLMVAVHLLEKVFFIAHGGEPIQISARGVGYFSHSGWKWLLLLTNIRIVSLATTMEECRATCFVLFGGRRNRKKGHILALARRCDANPSHFLPRLQRAYDGGGGAQAEPFVYGLWLPNLWQDFG
jgi:hypothetical protein